MALLVLQRLLGFVAYNFWFIASWYANNRHEYHLIAFVAKKSNKNTCSRACRLLNFQHFVDLFTAYTALGIMICLLLFVDSIICGFGLGLI